MLFQTNNSLRNSFKAHHQGLQKLLKNELLHLAEIRPLRLLKYFASRINENLILNNQFCSFKYRNL